MKPKTSLLLVLCLIALTFCPLTWTQRTAIRQKAANGKYCRGPCRLYQQDRYLCVTEDQSDNSEPGTACSPLGKEMFGHDCRVDSPCTIYPEGSWCYNVVGGRDWCSIFEYDSLEEYDSTGHVCNSPCQMADDGHFYCGTPDSMQSPCSPIDGATTENDFCTSRCDYDAGNSEDFPWWYMWCRAEGGEHSWWGECSPTKSNSVFENSFEKDPPQQPISISQKSERNNDSRVYDPPFRQVLNTAHRLRVAFAMDNSRPGDFMQNVATVPARIFNLAIDVLVQWKKSGFKLTESTSTLIPGDPKGGVRLDMQYTFTEAGRFFYNLALQVNGISGVTTIAQMIVDSDVVAITYRHLLFGLSKSLRAGAAVRIQQEPTF